MTNKLLKTAGYLILALTVAAIGTVVWYGINASRNTDIAQPYFDAHLPVIVGWDFDALEPLLTPSLKASFSSDEGQRVFRRLSQLGELQSFEQLQYIGADAQVAVDGGAYDLLQFTLLGHFREGDALVLVTLAQTDDSFLVHGLNIRSDAIAAPRNPGTGATP
ncbi:hypothetical protein [Marinobacter mobilis]|uniref:Uncharacterized protein n=1 Tax=Marinobacter mobilis TaxID=488533 RepID=A0A1H2Y8T0_9GAMM|nr:hypothetical protein [Marinobacter mobilis]SDX01566.1 hypothetical protein SAMN04487960_105299 [Marinobacter mobilis]SDX49121.1 hypothetical protein SAMN04487960_11029 [Marinobacter mobilis]